MELEFAVDIDQGLCNGCKLCVAACPADIFTMEGELATATGERDRCIHCDHCAAICPTSALTVRTVDADALRLTTIPTPEDEPVERPSAAALFRLMRERRSCRNYRRKPVDRAVLEDLVKIGITAPTGTNSQQWTFTLLPTRQAVLRFGELAARFFKQLNWVVRLPPARWASWLLMKDQLGEYYRENYERVQEALEDWDRTGRDLLFHGATAAILVGARPGGSTPKEDALLAAENIVLAAEALGLGTCLVGYAVEALAADPRIKRDIGVPADERIYAVIGVGHPKVRFRRPAGRRAVTPRYFEG